jgi:hypothetical protein
MFFSDEYPQDAKEVADKGKPTDSASERMRKVLKRTATTLGFGITHFDGIPTGTSGFKSVLDDHTNNQVGHFLTAVQLGFDPSVTKSFWAWLGFGIPEQMAAEDAAIRLCIGHEKLGDNESLRDQFKSATDEDVKVWWDASQALNQGPLNASQALNQGPLESDLELNLGTALTVLKKGIKIGTGPGNSEADLLLSLLGWTLGRSVPSERLTTKDQIGKWIMENIHKNKLDDKA